jgi:MFS family permease
VRGEILLLVAIAIAFLGFPIFWLATFAPVNILGLLITGLGVANFYPLVLALAVGAAKSHSDLATARLSIGVGMAILISPFILGGIADQLNLKVAFGFVIVMLVAIAVVTLVGVYLSAKKPER